MLHVERVSVSFGGRRILDQVEVQAPAGSFTAVAGPNGSGKSTLLRTIYRAHRPDSGRVLIDGTDLWSRPAGWSARRTGVLMQEQHTGFDFTVAETVAMGRTPHLRGWDRISARDTEIVDDVLTRTGLTAFARRRVGALSGGERQRVFLARALAQQPRLLVLDEPTNHLDIRHQLDLLELVRGLGITVVAALHDLDLATAYADTIVVLREGTVHASGPPTRVLTPPLIREVFGVVVSPTGMRPACVCPQQACLWSCTHPPSREG